MKLLYQEREHRSVYLSNRLHQLAVAPLEQGLAQLYLGLNLGTSADKAKVIPLSYRIQVKYVCLVYTAAFSPTLCRSSTNFNARYYHVLVRM